MFLRTPRHTKSKWNGTSSTLHGVTSLPFVTSLIARPLWKLEEAKDGSFLSSGEFGLLTANAGELTFGSLRHCFPPPTRTCLLDTSLLNCLICLSDRRWRDGQALSLPADESGSGKVRAATAQKKAKSQNPHDHMTPTPRGPRRATILNHSLVTDVRQSGGQSISGHTHTHAGSLPCCCCVDETQTHGAANVKKLLDDVAFDRLLPTINQFEVRA